MLNTVAFFLMLFMVTAALGFIVLEMPAQLIGELIFGLFILVLAVLIRQKIKRQLAALERGNA